MEAARKRLIVNGRHVDDFWLIKSPVSGGVTGGASALDSLKTFDPVQDFGDLRPDIDQLLQQGSVDLRQT